MPSAVTISSWRLTWPEQGEEGRALWAHRMGLNVSGKPPSGNRRKWCWQERGCPLVAVLLFPVLPKLVFRLLLPDYPGACMGTRKQSRSPVMQHCP